MQDREPDEFHEAPPSFKFWLLFRQNRVALFSFYFICYPDFGRTFSEAHHAL